jgi:hypothetical protein
MSCEKTRRRRSSGVRTSGSNEGSGEAAGTRAEGGAGRSWSRRSGSGVRPAADDGSIRRAPRVWSGIGRPVFGCSGSDGCADWAGGDSAGFC